MIITNIIIGIIAVLPAICLISRLFIKDKKQIKYMAPEVALYGVYIFVLYYLLESNFTTYLMAAGSFITLILGCDSKETFKDRMIWVASALCGLIILAIIINIIGESIIDVITSENKLYLY